MAVDETIGYGIKRKCLRVGKDVKTMKVSIIIPNYNGKHFMKDCMESLEEQTFRDFEVIVVDNASTDGSVEFMKEDYPSVRLVEMETNTGFSGAVNAGIKKAKAPYVFLLNNDTECEPDCVEKLYHAIKKSKKIFSVASCMIQLHHRELMDSAGDVYTMLGWAFNRGNGKPVEDYQCPAKIFTACAGAAIYQKAVFDEIGYFDEQFFAYREDIDVGYRARVRGYYNLYCPEAKVYHVGSGTSGSTHNPFKVRLGVRNNIYLVYKNMPLPFLVWNLPWFFLGYVIKGIYFAKKGFGADYLEGVKEAFQTLKTVEKQPFHLRDFGNHLVIQLELYIHTWNIVQEKIGGRRKKFNGKKKKENKS